MSGNIEYPEIYLTILESSFWNLQIYQVTEYCLHSKNFRQNLSNFEQKSLNKDYSVSLIQFLSYRCSKKSCFWTNQKLNRLMHIFIFLLIGLKNCVLVRISPLNFYPTRVEVWLNSKKCLHRFLSKTIYCRKILFAILETSFQIVHDLLYLAVPKNWNLKDNHKRGLHVKNRGLSSKNVTMHPIDVLD